MFEFNENDSLAYKTNFYDFRGEKGRDKSKDVSPLSFAMRNYQTSKARAEEAEAVNLKSVFTEKYHKKEESFNQVMRPT